ncbi:MAG: hypothetical protein CMH13_11110 [Martelella sp.]|uniref:hypothetical protein n=1 Tax=Martelella sp. TaxID=1969699 RepID=UPI000C488669|nr:hypothetical protein [Martelella sp.]MAU21068.1 hypothetical protein [Martelella sp.]
MLDKAARMNEIKRRLMELNREITETMAEMVETAGEDPHWEGLADLKAERNAARLALNNVCATAQATAMEFSSGIKPPRFPRRRSIQRHSTA